MYISLQLSKLHKILCNYQTILLCMKQVSMHQSTGLTIWNYSYCLRTVYLCFCFSLSRGSLEKVLVQAQTRLSPGSNSTALASEGNGTVPSLYPPSQQPWTQFMGSRRDSVYTHPHRWYTDSTLDNRSSAIMCPCDYTKVIVLYTC